MYNFQVRIHLGKFKLFWTNSMELWWWELQNTCLERLPSHTADVCRKWLTIPEVSEPCLAECSRKLICHLAGDSYRCPWPPSLRERDSESERIIVTCTAVWLHLCRGERVHWFQAQSHKDKLWVWIKALSWQIRLHRKCSIMGLEQCT